MHFVKYHALGNDYLVIEPAEVEGALSPELVRRICDRHYGVGCDGILLGPLSPADVLLAPSAVELCKDDANDSEGEDRVLNGLSLSTFGLRIFNPDGSEAEKSGNGLRIFARYLWDRGLLAIGKEVSNKGCSRHVIICTPGGPVRAQVLEDGRKVTVEMGQASFESLRIPVSGPRRQVIDERMMIAGKELRYCALTLGNPHCVILCGSVSPDMARQYGPLVEADARFPQRVNVQFMEVLDAHNIQIEIWERGAGYTLASGSSSCAAAAVAVRLGWCASPVTVHMPGGQLEIRLDEQLNVVMSGPVEKVFEGFMEVRDV